MSSLLYNLNLNINMITFFKKIYLKIHQNNLKKKYLFFYINILK
jgi:hypothetical protein